MVTSAGTAITSAPLRLRASAVSLSNTPSRAVKINAAPPAANASAMPRPIPRFAPVIKAILLSSLRIYTSLYLFDFAIVYVRLRRNSAWRVKRCQFYQSVCRSIHDIANDQFSITNLLQVKLVEAMKDDYGLSKPKTGALIEAPVLPYLPRNP